MITIKTITDEARKLVSEFTAELHKLGHFFKHVHDDGTDRPPVVTTNEPQTPNVPTSVGPAPTSPAPADPISQG